MPQTLEYLEYMQAEAPRAVLIWLHGLGASGHDFVPFVSELPLPDGWPLRFVFPHAPERPITLNGGMRMRGWYDILGLTRDTPEDRDGILVGAEQVGRLIEAERARHPGLPILLGGFSQGGALALYCALRRQTDLAAVMGLACYLPLAGDTPQASAKPAPIFWGHGTDDDLVPAAWGREGSALLGELGYSVDFREYPLGHSVSPAQLVDLGGFIGRCLAAAAENGEL